MISPYLTTAYHCYFAWKKENKEEKKKKSRRDRELSLFCTGTGEGNTEQWNRDEAMKHTISAQVPAGDTQR